MKVNHSLMPLKSKTLQRRLLKYFLLVSIIPMIILGIAFYSITNNIIIQMASTYSVNIMDRVNSDLENLFQLANRLAKVAVDSPLVQDALRKQFSGVEERYSYDLAVSSELRYAAYYNEIFGIDVVGQNGGEYKSHFRSFKQEGLMHTAWYNRIVNENKAIWFAPHKGSFASETIGENVITLGYPVIDKKTGNISGVVLVDILESKILDIINSRLGQNGYFIILNENNKTILNPNPSKTQINIEDIQGSLKSANDGEMHTFNHEKGMVVTKSSKLTGWKLVGIIPSSELQANSTFIAWVMALLILAICFLAAFIAYRLSASVSSPIKKMTKLMKKVEAGDLNVNIDISGEDEIGQLGHSFDLMIGKINELMQKVYTEQRNLRKAEFRALQAQINPHFLYNTLDSIIWLARENKK